MDFAKLLKAADKNNQKASKQVKELSAEVSKEKNAARIQLEAEKRAREAIMKQKAARAKEIERRKNEKAEDDRKKNFTIPKKGTGSGANPDALRAYYERKEREKQEKLKKAEEDKDKLMKLRMQANGGKATKKLGKHFGMDVVDLQIRFGGNNEHVETLQKRQMRDVEEQEREADRYRQGIYKAIQMKKKTEEKVRPTGEKHRVATSKSNSLAGLCARHEKTRDRFSPPKDNEKIKPKSREEPKKKIYQAPAVDFGRLMQAAQNNTEGKAIDSKLIAPALLPKKPASSSYDRRPLPNGSSSNRPSGSSSSSSKPQPVQTNRPVQKRPEPPRSSQSSSGSSSQKPMKKEDKKEKGQNGRFQKGPTPPPLIPPAVEGKRYLPGDARYKELAKKNPSISSSKPLSDKERVNKVREQEREREREREKMRQLKRARDQRMEDEVMAKRSRMEMKRPCGSSSVSSQKDRLERERERKKKYEAMIRARKHGSQSSSSSFFRGGDDYSDNDDDEEEDDYEDDYDSEMDDFIDDTETGDDGINRKEFEDTLRMVNRKYDKKKWAYNEKTINERDMVSNYRRIQSEENYSKRAGAMEDLKEEAKGRSVRL